MIARKVVFAAVALVTLGSAAAQETAPRSAPAPLVVNDDTVGILRQRQVGSLILPQGTPPFPAVIVLHGCNGISRNTRVWARRLASWGYAALIVDSFTTRGLHQVCDGSRALPGPVRARDVYTAAAYLRSRRDIDARRIGALGYSHGGWTGLAASTQRAVERFGGPPIAAVVSLYPFCPKVALPLASDVLILAGDADDWAPSSRCTEFSAKYSADAAHRPSLVVYPGAHHSFDAQAPDRVYFGHNLRYDPKAIADALVRIRQFLDQHLRR
jgi:dienelactone hydrolase